MRALPLWRRSVRLRVTLRRQLPPGPVRDQDVIPGAVPASRSGDHVSGADRGGEHVGILRAFLGLRRCVAELQDVLVAISAARCKASVSGWVLRSALGTSDRGAVCCGA